MVELHAQQNEGMLKAVVVGAFLFLANEVLGAILAWYPIPGLGFIGIMLWVAAVVIGAMWFGRLGSNADHLNRSDRSFSTALGVVFWFIPLANLILPYFVAKELWRASSPDDDWKNSEVPGYLHLWWALWGLAGLLGVIATIWTFAVVGSAVGDGFSDPDNAEQLAEDAAESIGPTIAILTTGAAVLIGLATPLYLRFSKQISARQDELIMSGHN